MQGTGVGAKGKTTLRPALDAITYGIGYNP